MYRLTVILLLASILFPALAEEPVNTSLRTRHLSADGNPIFTNRLSQESSPYLQQHAHNPVDWYPWGDEAFRIANEQGKPVLLSIGYSTCHWCHVMEEESFENLEIAAYLNKNYIAIKVDREERPDLDRAYMAAVEAFSGSGGWPMTVWLTPAREPFYGTTYLPPYDGDRGVQIGFFTRLKSLRQAWDENNDQVARIAQQLSAAVRSRLLPAAGTELPVEEIFERAYNSYAAAFDAKNGGLQNVPKFASHLPSRFLMRYFLRSGEEQALRMVDKTLRSMAYGGIFDQVGGGFHRYSTDAAWAVPHFEKMLYDNALQAITYLEAYQLTGNKEFARVCREILQYATRDMGSADGGFYVASDADSLLPSGESVEGAFFTWTVAEIANVLPASDFELVGDYFAIDDAGDIDGRNVLRVAAGDVVADSARATIQRAKDSLYAARSKRPSPFVDKKILTAWNGLMISAFARASLDFGDESYLHTAIRAADFVLSHMSKDGRLLRSYLAGEASGSGYADDYAFTIQALLDLYEASGDIHWYQQAARLQALMTEDFGDAEGGGFFFSSLSNEITLAREKPAYDSSMPSANSVAVMNLLRFYEMTSDDAYRVQAQNTIRTLNAAVARAPAAAPDLLQALDFFMSDAKTIVIVTATERAEAQPFLQVLGRTFLPNHVLSVVQEGEHLEQHAALLPIIEGKRALQGKATAYVCIHGICDLPTTDVAVFATQIGPGAP